MYAAFLLYACAFFSRLPVKFSWAHDDHDDRTIKVRILYLIIYFPFATFWVIRAGMLQGELPVDHTARVYVVYNIATGSWTIMPIVLKILDIIENKYHPFRSLARSVENLWDMHPPYQIDYNDEYQDYDYDGPLPYGPLSYGPMPYDDIYWDVDPVMGIGYQPPNQQTLHKHNIIKIQLQELTETQCLICWEDFAAGDDLVGIEGCGHPFHAECLKTWTAKVTQCPTCKIDVKAEFFESK